MKNTDLKVHVEYNHAVLKTLAGGKLRNTRLSSGGHRPIPKAV